MADLKLLDKAPFISRLREELRDMLGFEQAYSDGPSWRMVERGHETFVEIWGDPTDDEEYREFSITVADVTNGGEQ